MEKSEVSVSFTLDSSQTAALELAAREPISIITGGPGTGKTTIIKSILERLVGLHIALCAPTGKAAKRMQEATGHEAKTIHRLLAYNPETGFWYGVSDMLPHDVIIVDETSMVDVELFAHLLKAIDERRTRLILVGDYNQLPSVGPGAILADLVKSNLVPCARLTQLHRSSKNSWVCLNAPHILKGEVMPLVKRPDFYFIEVKDAANVAKYCGDELEKNPHLQILAPQRTKAAGTRVLNEVLQKRFNPLRPRETEWKWELRTLRPRDKVIHTVNNYELGVFNGECGVVVSIDKKEQTLCVQYPDRKYTVTYTRSDARDLRLAYALTIHKSQGSEWPWIAVVIHSTNTFMLTRQLLYTAVTRGKEGVIIVGNRKGIEAALKCKRDSTRNTALCDRIRGEL